MLPDEQVVYAGALDASDVYEARDLWTDACPLTREVGGLEPWVLDVVRLARAATDLHALPVAGGALQQPAQLADALQVVLTERATVEASRAAAERRRLESERERHRHRGR